MSKKFIVLFFIMAFFSLGAAEQVKVKGFEYSVDAGIYSEKELMKVNPKLSFLNTIESGQSKELMAQFGLNKDNYHDSCDAFYLYGNIKLEKEPEDLWSKIPGCKLIIWNKDFKYVINIGALGSEKHYFLIPLGSYISTDKFKYKIVNQ